MQFPNVSTSVRLAYVLRLQKKRTAAKITARQLAILWNVSDLSGEGGKPVPITNLWRSGFGPLYRLNYTDFSRAANNLVDVGYLNRTERQAKQYKYINYTLTISGVNLLHDIESSLIKAKKVKGKVY